MMDLKSLVPRRNGNKAQLPATREDFFDPFVTFRREMDRMFEDFFGGGTLRVGQGEHMLMPAVNVEETEKELLVSAELPGVTEKDVEVNLAGDTLTIRGEKKAEHEEQNGDSYHMERRFGSFSRAIRLPFEVRDEDVEAKFSNGVLAVRLPKPAELQKPARRIEVKTR
jgi:HSP20 family protein